MATQNLVQRKMQVTLNSAAPAADLNGRPQWELRCVDPFSAKGYEAKYYISAVEGETPPPAAVYWCLITQGALKTSTDPARPYDGSFPWMFRHKIAQRADFNISADAPEPPPVQNIVQPTPMAPVGAVNGTGTPYVPPANPTTSERQSVFNAAASLIVATDLVDQSPEVILGRIASITGVRPEYAGDLWTILQNIGSEAPPATESVEVEEFDEEPLPWS